MIHFKFAAHTLREVQIVEVWDDDIMIAAFYPGVDPATIRIISKYSPDCRKIGDCVTVNFTLLRPQ